MSACSAYPHRPRIRGGRRGAGAVNASLRAPDIADPESMVIRTYPAVQGGIGARYRPGRVGLSAAAPAKKAATMHMA